MGLGPAWQRRPAALGLARHRGAAGPVERNPTHAGVNASGRARPWLCEEDGGGVTKLRRRRGSAKLERPGTGRGAPDPVDPGRIWRRRGQRRAPWAAAAGTCEREGEFRGRGRRREEKEVERRGGEACFLEVSGDGRHALPASADDGAAGRCWRRSLDQDR